MNGVHRLRVVAVAEVGDQESILGQFENHVSREFVRIFLDLQAGRIWRTRTDNRVVVHLLTDDLELLTRHSVDLRWEWDIIWDCLRLRCLSSEVHEPRTVQRLLRVVAELDRSRSDFNRLVQLDVREIHWAFDDLKKEGLFVRDGEGL